MEHTHGTPELSPTLASEFGRGPALAFGLAGTLALGWVIAMVYVIASWATGS
ncbi:hypothetical protein F0L17_21865 [Streptomyces sp. TRM43335]|uniref:Uncharacterized protein n=1 Tax=Streptomyces taklimakanensis TaxID=2569853 RepID=A0A6G2BHI4_9ACTN|nr:hypothetical protein [Streptomyces taklimakanensis]MTE21710.1 hypothetical protein [Streptomyces taklimakanensis]